MTRFMNDFQGGLVLLFILIRFRRVGEGSGVHTLYLFELGVVGGF